MYKISLKRHERPLNKYNKDKHHHDGQTLSLSNVVTDAFSLILWTLFVCSPLIIFFSVCGSIHSLTSLMCAKFSTNSVKEHFVLVHLH